MIGRGLSDARRRHHALSLPPPVHRGAPRMRRCAASSPSSCCAARRTRRARRSRRPWWLPPIRWRSRRASRCCAAAARRSTPRSRCRWCWASSSRMPRASAAAASCCTTRRKGGHRRSMTDARRRRRAPARRCSSTATASRSSFAEAVVSGLSVGVPGALAMLELAHKRARQACRGASCSSRRSRLARDGVRGVAAARRLRSTGECRDGDDPTAARSTSTPTARPEAAATRITNPALAETMQPDRRAGRARASTRAPSRDEIVERVHRHVRPGTLSPADLAGYKPIKREPVCGPYRVWIVCGMPPPSSGGIAVLQVLALLEPFELWRDKPDDLRAPPSHRRGEPARLRRPRPLCRRSGVRPGAGGRPAGAGLSRRAPQADLARPQHGRRRSRRAAGLCRARHQPHHHRRSLGQCRGLHHHHRGAVRLAHHGAAAFC